jgi:hypothetical protein
MRDGGFIQHGEGCGVALKNAKGKQGSAWREVAEILSPRQELPSGFSSTEFLFLAQLFISTEETREHVRLERERHWLCLAV